jgi:hypothetical protein
VRWHHRYVDITSISPQGRFLLDYTKFNDTIPEKLSREPRVAP